MPRLAAITELIWAPRLWHQRKGHTDRKNNTTTQSGGASDMSEALGQFQRCPTATDAVRLIDALARKQDLDSAFAVYDILNRARVVNSAAVASLAKACVENGKPDRAVPLLWQEVKRLHLSLSPFCFGTLVRACAKAGDATTACDMFAVAKQDKWLLGRGNASIIACSQFVQAMAKLEVKEKALEACVEVWSWMHDAGIEANAVFYIVLLGAIGELGGLEQGRRIHRVIEKTELAQDAKVGATLIAMYGKLGRALDAQRVFDGIEKPALTTWNAMFAVYSQHGGEAEAKRAIKLYQHMRQHTEHRGDVFTMCSMLKACGIAQDIDMGRELHECIGLDANLRDSENVKSTLIAMYGRCGRLAEARQVFDTTSRFDSTTWAAMISAYAQHEGHSEEAIKLFKQLQRRTDSQITAFTISSVLKACSNAQELALGRELHARIALDANLSQHLEVQNALITMYGKCGRQTEARHVFDRMNQRALTSWNAMISVYSQQEDTSEGGESGCSTRWRKPAGNQTRSRCAVCSRPAAVFKTYG
jgi:hypothetical protein